jgi:hypothetical protein
VNTKDVAASVDAMPTVCIQRVLLHLAGARALWEQGGPSIGLVGRVRGPVSWMAGSKTDHTPPVASEESQATPDERVGMGPLTRPGSAACESAMG